MKKHLFVTLLAGLLIQAGLFAQDKAPVVPEWVSEKGWWVVESNSHTPKKHIVYFYNNDGVLVYKEKIEGLRINPSKKTTRLQLKQVLETSVLAWENKQELRENQALVINCLRHK
jgi:hypothetical protein